MDVYNAMKSIRKVHHSKSSKEKVFNDSKKMDKDFYYDVLKVNVNIVVKEILIHVACFLIRKIQRYAWVSCARFFFLFEKFNKAPHGYTGTADTNTNIVDGDHDDCHYNLIFSIVDGDYEIMMVVDKESNKEADSSLRNLSENLALIIKTQKIGDSVFLICESLMSDPLSETLLLKNIYS